MSGPLGCVAAVTYRCNSRCTMCDIWRQDADAERELAPSDYRWLPASLRVINVSGGEPFLRDDLPEVVDAMREACPRARIAISTNGLAPDVIEASVSRMGDVAVRVSIDAVGEAHDRLRGVPGAYESALETVRRLRSLGVRDLGVAATSTAQSAGELSGVKAKADEMGVQFVASAVHSSPIFFGDHETERPHSIEAVTELENLEQELLASRRPKDWAKAYYMRGLIDYVMGKPRRLPCLAGRVSFFIDPWGDVYPCNISGTRMGNIRDGSFDELTRRTRTRVDEAVATCKEQCWMVCTVTPPMLKRPLRPAAWIAGAKLFGIGTKAGS